MPEFPEHPEQPARDGPGRAPGDGGNDGTTRVVVQEPPFDIAGETERFARVQRELGPLAGAIVTFTGVVRDSPAGGLETLEIERYPGMTERAIAGIVAEARGRWPLTGATVIHRYGALRLGEPIMMVATASASRAAAFAAAEFLMDYLKSRAPFWKREIGASGSEWVASKDSDETALARWSEAGPP